MQQQFLCQYCLGMGSVMGSVLSSPACAFGKIKGALAVGYGKCKVFL